jgi:hypothetical protein
VKGWSNNDRHTCLLLHYVQAYRKGKKIQISPNSHIGFSFSQVFLWHKDMFLLSAKLAGIRSILNELHSSPHVGHLGIVRKQNKYGEVWAEMCKYCNGVNIKLWGLQDPLLHPFPFHSQTWEDVWSKLRQCY